MSSQLQIPCLGRPFNLGMLYDCRTEKLIPGLTLWDAEKLKSCLLTNKQLACDIEVTSEDTFQSKTRSLGIGADLKLSLISDMVEVKGAAKFLQDRKSSGKQSRVTLQYKSTTHFEQLTMDQLSQLQHPHVADKWDATHVVTGITYGADAFLIFDRSITKGEAIDKISNSMKVAVQKIPSYFGGTSGGSSQFYSNIDETEISKFNCKFHGDFIPKSNPTTFDEALKLCKDLPELLKEECKPKVAYLTPLSKLIEGYQQVVHSIPQNMTSQIEDIIENFHHAEMHASDLMEQAIFSDLKKQLTKFKRLLNSFQRDFVEKLACMLPKIRRTGAEEEGMLIDLLFSVSRSPFNPMETKAYLDGKDREISQLAQYIANMRKMDRIHFDFSDTKHSLLTLISNEEIRHVVCFAFNVTSATSPYLESLESYVNTGKICGSAIIKEWFDILETTSQLRSEMRKFLKYSEVTSASSEMAYIVTSSDSTTSAPATIVYSTGIPMLLNPPGTPQAVDVTIDSITLKWTPPRDVQVQSYRVLYREKNKSEFESIDSAGLMTTRYIKDLSHGIEYEFQVQVTSTSGFAIKSDIACIKTTEYYDIVLIGKTGQGKSTLGNKLLDLKRVDKSKVRLFDLSAAPDKKKWFVQADDADITEAGAQFLSVTGKCKIMSNENSKIRVLDVPGFADSGALLKATGQNISVYEGNLQIVRLLVREQIQSQLKVRRIVYFLPVRGPLEKADGTLQEELKVLHHYFGKEVFNCVVVAATNYPKEKYQNLPFNDNDLSETKKVFHTALKMAVDEDIASPPIIYIGYHDNPKELLSKIQGAAILKESILPLEFSDRVCARCSYTIRYDHKSKEKICVIDASGRSIPYKDSKCHPCFIQKYTKAQKIIGGIGHIFVIGTALAAELLLNVNTWPGFTNSDEVCVLCKMSPGSEGCKKAETEIPLEKNGRQEIMKVYHSNTL